MIAALLFGVLDLELGFRWVWSEYWDTWSGYLFCMSFWVFWNET